MTLAPGPEPAPDLLPPPPAPESAFERLFASLRSRSFRWYFAAMLGNFGAMNVQLGVGGWLVFKLTGSFADLGLVHLANGLAGLAVALAGGVLADRASQKKTIVQLGQALQGSAALEAFALRDLAVLVLALALTPSRFSQLSALARMRAAVVLPTPRAPANR